MLSLDTIIQLWTVFNAVWTFDGHVHFLFNEESSFIIRIPGKLFRITILNGQSSWTQKENYLDFGNTYILVPLNLR